jgi:hypothetical protein
VAHNPVYDLTKWFREGRLIKTDYSDDFCSFSKSLHKKCSKNTSKQAKATSPDLVPFIIHYSVGALSVNSEV